MIKIVEQIKGPASYNLPPRFVREIGRIVVSWSYYEYCIQEMCWQALTISAAAGRLSTKEPRASDRLEMLSALIELRNGTWDLPLYKSMLAQTKLLEMKRNLVAHGIWAYLGHSGEWHVQLARGSWPKNQSELVKGSKKIIPESVHMTVPMLREATSAIEKLLGDLKRLRQSALDKTPSPQKHPEQSDSANPTLGQGAKAPPYPPRS